MTQATERKVDSPDWLDKLWADDPATMKAVREIVTKNPLPDTYDDLLDSNDDQALRKAFLATKVAWPLFQQVMHAQYRPVATDRNEKSTIGDDADSSVESRRSSTSEPADGLGEDPMLRTFDGLLDATELKDTRKRMRVGAQPKQQAQKARQAFVDTLAEHNAGLAQALRSRPHPTVIYHHGTDLFSFVEKGGSQRPDGRPYGLPNTNVGTLVLDMHKGEEVVKILFNDTFDFGYTQALKDLVSTLTKLKLMTRTRNVEKAVVDKAAQDSATVIALNTDWRAEVNGSNRRQLAKAGAGSKPVCICVLDAPGEFICVVDFDLDEKFWGHLTMQSGAIVKQIFAFRKLKDNTWDEAPGPIPGKQIRIKSTGSAKQVRPALTALFKSVNAKCTFSDKK